MLTSALTTRSCPHKNGMSVLLLRRSPLAVSWLPSWLAALTLGELLVLALYAAGVMASLFIAHDDVKDSGRSSTAGVAVCFKPV